MHKKQFFDDRMRYFAFTQNTNEKTKFSELILPYIENLGHDRSCLRILDAGTGDGSIMANIIKAFHKYHPTNILSILGKEISYKDLKNTLDKLSDRFAEHPRMLVTLTNVKFSQIEQLNVNKKINGKNIKILKIELSGSTSFDFQNQVMSTAVIKFITRFWGISADNSGNTQYTNPCIIKIYRQDSKEVLFSDNESSQVTNNFDLIIASQAYRSRSIPERKVKYVISPLAKLLNQSGELLITHSTGGKQVNEILNTTFNNINAFPSVAKDLISQLERESKNDKCQYTSSTPFTYQFSFTQAPLGMPLELFGREVDAKIESLLYFGQITDQEINTLNGSNERMMKLRESLQAYPELLFENEFFTLKRLPNR